MKKSEKIAPLGISTIVYYFLTSLIAVTVGLIAVNTIKPGILNGEKTSEVFGLSSANPSFKAEIVSSDHAFSDFDYNYDYDNDGDYDHDDDYDYDADDVYDYDYDCGYV